MSDYDRPNKKKQSEIVKANPTKRVDRRTPSNTSGGHAASNLIGPTPFQPQVEIHAALISNTPSAGQRAIVARQLQQTYGNRYVQRLIKSIDIQRKLTVGAVDDPFEHEADAVAEQVMNMPVPPMSQHSPNNHNSVQRQTPEEEEPAQMKVISRIAEGHVPLKPLMIQEASERPETQQTKNQTNIEKTFNNQDAKPENEDRAQTDPQGTFDVGGRIEQTIESQGSSGTPLPSDVRTFMEPRFGTDFSSVRIHTGSEASQLNRSLRAQAFTHGQDIYIGEGKYSPNSQEGKRLLAHELTHAVQQSQPPKIQREGEAATAVTEPQVTPAAPASQAAAPTPGTPAANALRAVWDASVVGSVRQAHTILSGSGSLNARSRQAAQQLQSAIDTINTIKPSYSNNAALFGRLAYMESRLETLRIGLKPFYGSRLAMPEIVSLLAPSGPTFESFNSIREGL